VLDFVGFGVSSQIFGVAGFFPHPQPLSLRESAAVQLPLVRDFTASLPRFFEKMRFGLVTLA